MEKFEPMEIICDCCCLKLATHKIIDTDYCEDCYKDWHNEYYIEFMENKKSGPDRPG